MNGAPDNPKWILQCRDLVQLYYGVRMVAATRESTPGFQPNVTGDLVPVDPRRIRYEISIQNYDAAPQFAGVGTQQAFAYNKEMQYNVPAGNTIQIERDFLSDLDAVTEGLQFVLGNDNMSINIRETFLTPLPADES